MENKIEQKYEINSELINKSQVRYNLMNVKNYSPYCGNERCKYSWPRTSFNGNQFLCRCGWKSEFPESFIAEYKQHWFKK